MEIKEIVKEKYGKAALRVTSAANPVSFLPNLFPRTSVH